MQYKQRGKPIHVSTWKKRRKIHEVLGIFGGDLQHGLEIYLEDYMYNIRHFSALEF